MTDVRLFGSDVETLAAPVPDIKSFGLNAGILVGLPRADIQTAGIQVSVLVPVDQPAPTSTIYYGEQLITNAYLGDTPLSMYLGDTLLL